MNILYHIVNIDLKDKNKCNYAIAYDPKFDNKFSFYIGLPMEPFKLVTASLRGGKRNRATIIAKLT